MQDPRATNPVKPIVGPPEQIKGAAPIITRDLPNMEKVGSVKTVLTHATRRAMVMDSLPVAQGQAFMTERPDPSTAASASKPARTDSPQRGRPPPTDVGPSDGYIRVEMHFEKAELTIVDVHEVAGPLTPPATVAHGYVYEAVLGEQQIALGSITDVGLIRSFANVDVPGKEGKHRVFPQPSFNFFVRIPRVHLTVSNLPHLNVLLHKVTDAPDKLEPQVSLLNQPRVAAVQIASLRGVRLEAIPAGIRPKFENLIGR